MWWFIVLTSVALVALGSALVANDIWRNRTTRRQLASNAAAPAPPWPVAASNVAATPSSGARYDTSSATPPPEDDGPMTGPSLPRLPALEAHWPRLTPEIDSEVAAVNAHLAPLGIVIGAPGAASWSLKNHGYGDYRRVLLDNESIGWLRLELDAGLGVEAKFKAHEAENAIFNRNSKASRQRAVGQLARALMECLSTAAQYANWRLTNRPRTIQPDPSTVTAAAPLPAAAVPQSTAALADDAIALVNSAFRDAGARLMPLRADQWPGPASRDARVLLIDANGALAGTMLVDPLADRIDIAVTAGRSATANAARRQSLPISGLSVHSLAEAVATAAWPAIAAALPPVPQGQ